MKLPLLTAASLIIALCPLAPAQTRQEFPPATPESVGMSTDALRALDDVIQGYIDREETVGAELMVIKDRKTIWHSAHGLADRDQKIPFPVGAIQCIRSQTKTFVGTAVQILVDEGKLHLTDRASQFLPSFDNDSHRAITIEQLLEHRSGLRLSSLLFHDFHTLSTVQEVADLAGDADPEFDPGTSFNYSDDGTDALTAIIEKVSHRPAEHFIQDRVITPVGMSDTIPVVHEGDPRMARMIPLYVGSPAQWNKYWSPDQKPMFPYFLGSQAMYSTCEDYARLLCLWADHGVVGGHRVLSDAAIDRGLRPHSHMDFPCGLTGLKTFYAQLWMVFGPGEDPATTHLVAFGHGGSDGTMAWMWPDRDLIVLYFTQSRGGLTSIQIDKDIDRLLLRGQLQPDAPAPQHDLAPLAGVYWNAEHSRYWAISVAPAAAGDKLFAEIQAQGAGDLVPAEPGDYDHWKFDLAPGLTIRFEHEPAQGGPVTAMIVKRPQDDERRFERVQASADLPSAPDLAALVKAAHGFDHFTGTIRREGAIESSGAKGRFTSYMAPMRSRSDLDIAGKSIRVILRDGTITMRRDQAAVERLKGHTAAAALMDLPQIIFGGWLDAGAQAQVLLRTDMGGKPTIIVRVTPPGGYGSTIFVDEATSHVLKQDRILDVPGLGAIGQSTRYEDFESVGPLLLPRATHGEYAAEILGKSEVRVQKQEAIEPTADLFTMDAP
jgi:CubicO group peptidase (beta-lactamase class C family)